jgi:hypothetical protein
LTGHVENPLDPACVTRDTGPQPVDVVVVVIYVTQAGI